jgi:hypothetical protein
MKVKAKILVELSREESLSLLEEVKDIEVGVRPILHELLDRVAEDRSIECYESQGQVSSETIQRYIEEQRRT